MSWFYLALLAPLLYAVTNLIDDNLVQHIYEDAYIATTISGIFGALPLVSLIFLHAVAIPISLAALATLAGFLTVGYLFCYFKALGLEQPSVVIALFSLVPATLPFLATIFLNEHLTGLEIVGFLIVLVASFALTAVDIKKFKFSAALLPVLVAVVLVDIISLLTKHVYQQVEFYPAYMYFSAGLGAGGLTFASFLFFSNATNVLKRLKIPFKKVLPIIIVAELLSLSAEFTLNLAVSRGSVSIVRVIEGIQPMFVLLIALALFPFAPKYFREAEADNPGKKILLMVVAIVGLVLINIAVKR